MTLLSAPPSRPRFYITLHVSTQVVESAERTRHVDPGDIGAKPQVPKNSVWLDCRTLDEERAHDPHNGHAKGDAQPADRHGRGMTCLQRQHDESCY
jgi:hypothetical protein